MKNQPREEQDKRSKARENKSAAKVLRVDCASENHKIVKDGFYTAKSGNHVDIQEAFQSSMVNSIHYHYNHVFPNTRALKRKVLYKTKFNVVNCGAIQAAMDIHDTFKLTAATSATKNTTTRSMDSTHHHHIGILNFASAKNPGGGYLRGASAQEESLCRSSLLYPCLHQYENRRDHYYQINRRKRSGPSRRGAHFGTLYSNCAIFSPLVPVIRDDGPDANLLEHPCLVSFVTSPAPNKSILIQHQLRDNSKKKSAKSGKRCKENSKQKSAKSDKTITEAEITTTSSSSSLSTEKNDEELQNVMVQRIKRILKIFNVNECTDLVLGAFGCGVFGNDPKFVAAAFHRIIREEYNGLFNSITFAIWTPPKCLIPMEDDNYSAFVNEFALIMHSKNNNCDNST